MNLKKEPGLVNKLILKEQVKDYIVRRTYIVRNIIKVYTLIWGQCTEALQSAVLLNDLIDEK